MEHSDHILTPEYVRRNQEVFYQKDGGFYHAFRDKDGEVIATSYCLFPGVVLTFKEVHRHHYISNWRVRSDQGLRIEFCKEGCLECQVGTKSLNHMAGDVTLFHLDRRVCHQRYTLKDFYSISIAVDLEQFSSAPAGYFGKLDLEVESLQEKYQLKEQLFRVLRSPRELEHVFLEMLGAPDLNEFLSRFTCSSCGKRCLLASPSCFVGNGRQESAVGIYQEMYPEVEI